MEINDLDQFLRYYQKIKGRTRRLFPYIPPDKIEWTYREGKFTIGEIIRHLAAIERYMYGENVQYRPSQYRGCGTDYAEGYEATIQFYEDMHQESMAIFSQLTPTDLKAKCPTPGLVSITMWKWLRAMAEHEIHHRGQLYTYLGLLGIDPPPLYGLTSEQVVDNRGKKEKTEN